MSDFSGAAGPDLAPPPYRVLFSVGDPSGDVHAARVAAELKRRRSDIYLFGFGGPRMASAGVVLSHDNRGCSAIGVLESLRLVPRMHRILAALRQILHTTPPDLVVLVDYGVFNLRLAVTAKSVGVPVLYYIPPGCWARDMLRVTERVARWTDHVATPFPWSAGLLTRAGAHATFVGHPLLDGVESQPSREEARHRVGLGGDERGLAILPGSRGHEIRHILPLMLRAAALARGQRPELVPLVSHAPGSDRVPLQRAASKLLPEARFVESTADLLRASDVGLVKSGTITLEAALAGLPMVVTYAASPVAALQWHLHAARRVKYIAIPNILADREVVPERYGAQGRPPDLAREVLALYDDPARREAVRSDYAGLAAQLGQPGASRAVADLVEAMLDQAQRARTAGNARSRQASVADPWRR
ncbi:MAG TPA: lipid-A-disaccharide synthase [Armatimonadota bacterium]|nr:lipid-A-disaccharide synthase [Armatimonadota bacterium]